MEILISSLVLFTALLVSACSSATELKVEVSGVRSDSGKNSEGVVTTGTVPGKPAHHTTDGFRNLWGVPPSSSKGVAFYLRRVQHSVFTATPPDGHALDEATALAGFQGLADDGLTWIGQATFLIRLGGKTILTDPYFSEFASPLPWVGPRRVLPPGIPLGKLPPVDIIVVSHDHYDHLDDAAVRALPGKDRIQVVVPLGLKSFFVERGYGNVHELDWGHTLSVDGVTVSALPSVHDSGRSLNSIDKTLWASWRMEAGGRNLLFVGDSGFSKDLYGQIGNDHGPFDYVFLPIGAYEPRELMWMSHMTPEEAVAAGRLLRARTLIASHWGTINLSDEDMWEPPKRFSRAANRGGFDSDHTWILKVGESRAMR